ncbi:MAG: YdeI/OmpD-associated family protein [Bacteroidales bacterium]|nr:YdeI/OmpD-associated family protein [Lentimicrobiaceae bacterium]MDD5694584.1 YdeI/OmpD-associated family protein [Bacteroidales bacterium]
MGELEHKYFDSRKSFRNWLEENHNRSLGIWMIFYKKHVNIDCIEYNEALEEALCFGWIDSIIKKVDDDQYLRKFTPRTNVSKWSDLNKRMLLSLINEDKMTEAGLKKIDIYLKTGKVDWDVKSPKRANEKKEFHIPDFILKELVKNEPALTNFNNLAQTYKRHYILWITDAKREETILSRLKESIELLKENRKLGLK